MIGNDSEITKIVKSRGLLSIVQFITYRWRITFTVLVLTFIVSLASANLYDPVVKTSVTRSTIFLDLNGSLVNFDMLKNMKNLNMFLEKRYQETPSRDDFSIRRINCVVSECLAIVIDKSTKWNTEVEVVFEEFKKIISLYNNEIGKELTQFAKKSQSLFEKGNKFLKYRSSLKGRRVDNFSREGLYDGGYLIMGFEEMLSYLSIVEISSEVERIRVTEKYVGLLHEAISEKEKRAYIRSKFRINSMSRIDLSQVNPRTSFDKIIEQKVPISLVKKYPILLALVSSVVLTTIIMLMLIAVYSLGGRHHKA